MQISNTLTLAAFFAIGAVAIPTIPQVGPLEVFHHLPRLPTKWISHGPADKSATVKAQIGLKQSNIKGLQAKLLDISNPDSPNYGKWLSQEEAEAFTAPPAENVKAVKDWLSAHGITDVAMPTKDWIEFTVPVSKMESLLGAEYEFFSHPDSPNKIPRTQKYSVPKGLHGIIDLVTPTTAFYTRMTPHVDESVEVREIEPATLDSRATCNTNAITPSCINSLYNVDYTSKGSVTTASTLFIDVAASHSDYHTFGQQYSSNLKDFKDVSVSGGKNPGQGDKNTLLEGNLDTQVCRQCYFEPWDYS